MLIVPLSLISSNVLKPAEDEASDVLSSLDSALAVSVVAPASSLEPHAVNEAATTAVISNPLVNLLNNLFLISIVLFHLYFNQFFNCPRKTLMAFIIHVFLIQF